jgi:hypothetical protein
VRISDGEHERGAFFAVFLVVLTALAELAAFATA